MVSPQEQPVLVIDGAYLTHKRENLESSTGRFLQVDETTMKSLLTYIEKKIEKKLK